MDEFLRKLEEVIEAEADSISEDARFDDLPWDSLAALSAMVMIQEDYGVVLNNQDLKAVDSVSGLWSLVQERRAA